MMYLYLLYLRLCLRPRKEWMGEQQHACRLPTRGTVLPVNARGTNY